MNMEFIIAFCALLIGLLVGWLLARNQSNHREQQLTAELAVAQAQIKSQEQLNKSVKLRCS